MAGWITAQVTRAGCEKSWATEVTDYIWAYKVSRWDSRYTFAWYDSVFTACAQMGSLWSMGATQGPLMPLLVSALGMTVLHNMGGTAPTQQMGAQAVQVQPQRQGRCSC